MIALFLGAGFSKFWGLPLASEVMNIEPLFQKIFPGKAAAKVAIHTS